MGTQFDGLGHIGTLIGDEVVYYNGLKQSEVGGSYGLAKLGVHNVGVFFTRGVLLDVLAYKGGDRLPIGYVITPEDVQGTLARQGTREPGEGDVVLFHTGHGKLWMQDNAEYNKGSPGPGVTVARWLVDKQICLVGGDTWPVEAVPGENKERPFECHQWWITMNGIYIWRPTESMSSPIFSVRCASRGDRITGESRRGCLTRQQTRVLFPAGAAGTGNSQGPQGPSPLSSPDW